MGGVVWDIQPRDGVVRQIFGEVVALPIGDGDAGGVAHQVRAVLVGLAAYKAVEGVEALVGGPALEGAGRAHLPGGRVVPLAEGPCAEAAHLKDLGQTHGGVGHPARVAREGRGRLDDGAHVHAVVVAPRLEGRSGRGAQRGGVEVVEFGALFGELGESRRSDGAAEGLGGAEAQVVDEHDDDVGGAGGRLGTRVGARGLDLSRIQGLDVGGIGVGHREVGRRGRGRRRATSDQEDEGEVTHGSPCSWAGVALRGSLATRSETACAKVC